MAQIAVAAKAAVAGFSLKQALVTTLISAATTTAIGAISRAISGSESGTSTSTSPVSVGSAGQAIADGRGTYYAVGRLIWSGPKREIKRTRSVGGGKGFGGGGATETTVETIITCAYSFGYGPGKIRWVKGDKQILIDYRSDANGRLARGVDATVYDGTQSTKSALAVDTMGDSPSYRGQIIVEFERLPIGGDPPLVMEAQISSAGTTAASTTWYKSGQPEAFYIGDLFYDQDTRLLWCVFDDTSSNTYSYLMVFDPFTKEYVKIDAYADTMYIAPIRKVYGKIIIFGDAGWYVYDPDSYQLENLEAYSSTANDGWSTLLGYFGKSFSAYNYFYVPTQTRYFQSFTIPTGYADFGYVCERGNDALWILRKNITFEFCAVPFTPQPKSNGGVFGEVVESATKVNGTTSWSADGHGVYVDATDTFWIPVTSSTSSFVVEIDGGGELLQSVNLTTLGYGGWPAVSGTPLLHYSASTGELFFKDSNTLSRYNVSTGAYVEQSVNEGSAWSFYEPSLEQVFSGNEGYGTPPECTIAATKLSVVASTTKSGADILTLLAKRAGLTAAQIDATAITELLDGFPFDANKSYREHMSSIMEYTNAYAYESGGKVYWKKLGAAAVRTIDATELATTVGKAKRQGRYTHKFPSRVTVPRTLDLEFVSASSEGERLIERSRYYPAGHTRPESIETTVIMTSSAASAMVQRMHQKLLAAESYEGLRLLPKHLDLEPGDVINLTDGSVTHRVLITGLKTSPSLIVQAEGISDYVDHSTSYSISSVDEVVSSIDIFYPPNLIIMQTPVLRDYDLLTHAGPYVAAYRPFAGISAATIYSSADNLDYAEETTISEGATVALVEMVPADIDTIDAWDDLNELVVNFVSGDIPSSKTDAQVLNGANPFAYGTTDRWEVIQVGTVTQISGTLYRLSHLLRGRRGTDNEINTHALRDTLVGLSVGTVSRLNIDANNVGNDYYYKALRQGDLLQDVSPRNITVNGYALKPYTAVEISGTPSGSDIDFDWDRRTRASGSYGGTSSLIDNVGGPVNEDATSFEIDIVNPCTLQVMSSSAYTVTTDSWTYTQGNQISDETDHMSRFYLDIYQMSATVGRGFRARHLHVKTAYDAFIEAVFDLGPEMILQLNDGDQTNAYDLVAGSTNTNITYFSGSKTTTSLYGDSADEALATVDGVTYVRADNQISTLISGESECTVLMLCSNQTTAPATGDWLIYLIQGDTQRRFSARHTPTTGDYETGWQPKDAGGTVWLTPISDDVRTDNLVWMFSASANLTGGNEDNDSRFRAHMNGVQKTETILDTADSKYATTFQTRTRNSSFQDGICASQQATGAYWGGDAVAVFAIYKKELSPSTLRSIFHASIDAYYELIRGHGAISIVSMDSLYQTTTKSKTDYWGSFFMEDSIPAYWDRESSVVLCAESMQEVSNSSGHYRTDLMEYMKIQDITIEIWCYFGTAVGTNQPLMGIFPRNAYTDGRGIEMRVDSTNGLRGRIGTSAGWVEFDAATSNISTSTPYLCTLSVSSTTGVTLMLNGVSIASTATTYTIRWDDGSANGPIPGQYYINGANSGSSSSREANTGGSSDARYCLAVIYGKASSTAEALARYKYGAGVI